jgi:monoamine oxidase
VGGGIAGLVCAYRLKQASIPVRLFESQTRVGGRMWSSGEQFPGRVVELGGEFIDVGHKALRALVEEFHLELEDLRKDERGLRPAYFFGGKVRSEPELVAAMRPAVVKMKRDIEKIGDAPVPYEATGAFRALDAWSIDQWLRENRVTGWIGDLLRVAFTAELGLDPDDLSCIPMLQVVAIQGNKVQLYGDSDEGARIRGGTDQLPTRIAAQLGAAVEYETSLEAISKLPDGHVRLALKRGATSFDVKAERVVLALPFSTLRKVTIDESLRFSDRKMRSIQNLGYGTNAKLLIGYKSRAWRNSGFTGEIFTDRPFQSTWDETRAQSGAPGVLTVYTGGTAGVRLGDGDLDARGQSIVGQIEWVIPHTKAEAEGIFHRFPWPSFAPSLGSYSTWRVGQMTAFGGIEAAVEGGNVHFAGEHTSLAEQGFMDGAVESGERAAREVAGAMGIALPGQKAQAA